MAGMSGIYLAASNPINLLFQAIAEGFISKAHAQAMGTDPRRYVCILMEGAPTRWVWDSFLCPSGNMARDFIKNGAVNNYIGGSGEYDGSLSNLEYRAEKILNLPTGTPDIYMSPIWNRDIPTVGNGWVPMSKLLHNALLIRGVNMGQDVGHSLGPAKILTAEPGVSTLTGALAEHSHSSIKAVGLSQYDRYSFSEHRLGGFFSKEGLSPTIQRETGYYINRRGVDPLSMLMAPFIETNATVLSSSARQAELKTHMDAALREMSAFANSSIPGADELYRLRSDVDSVMRLNFGDLKAQYELLYAKYEDLVRRSGAPTNNIIPANDYGSYTGKSNPYANISGLASQFAIAEFLFRHDLSRNITISLTEGTSPTVSGISNKHDEHDQRDRQASLMSMSAEFRAISAVIYEFSRAIESSVWEDTVVQIGSEYDRLPHDLSYGTDHAADSNMLTFFSGAIQKPILIGNIKKNGREDARYKGTWGAAATVQTQWGELTIDPKIGVSTAAALLNIPSPSRSPALIDNVAGKFVSLAEGPKNV